MKIINRCAEILLTVGLALWLESLLTVEWTYPYCLSQSDGPAYAAYGMPLPYWMWNGVASLEHDFMPLAYVVNIFFLCLLMFPVIRWFLKHLNSPGGNWLRYGSGFVGTVLLIGHVALTGFLLSTGYFRPVSALGLDGYYRYSDFRPVRVGFVRSSAAVCTPSPFWFPKGWPQY